LFYPDSGLFFSTNDYSPRKTVLSYIKMTRIREQDIITKLEEKKGFQYKNLVSVMMLAVDIAREGRDGRKISTMFIVSE